LHDRRGLRDLWLVPLRDFVAMLLWAWAYAGDEIEWRGETFQLRDGKLFRIEQ
jgi:ceramide glucosyltransferase